MPDNFPGDAAHGFPDVVCPNNADVGDTTYLQQMAATVANRTALLKHSIDTLFPGGESHGLLKLPSLSFLRSYAGAGGALTEGDMLLVVGVGVYVWTGASTLTAVDPYVVTPSAIGAGPGRWLQVAPALYNGPRGLIGFYRVPSTTTHVVLGVGDVTLASITVPVVHTGDVLVLTASTHLSVASGGYAAGEHRIFLGGATNAVGSFTIAGITSPFALAAVGSQVVRGVYEVLLGDDGASFTLTQQVHVNAGTATVTGDASLFTVEHYR